MRFVIDDQAEALIARHKEHLPDGSDLTLLVLKGHLLVEESLDQLIGSSCPAPKYLLDARLTFAVKMRIARALTDHLLYPGYWDLIRALNKIRNGLAHKLDNPALEAALRDFMRLRQKHMGVLEDVPIDDAQDIDRERLRSDISLLIGQLYGWAAGLRTIVRAIEPWQRMVECSKGTD